MSQQGPDYGIFEVGAVTKPIPTGGQNDLLKDADPAIYYYVDFLIAMLRKYERGRFMQAVNAANLTQITDIVMQNGFFPFEPTPHFLESQIPFPALFVYRTRGHTEQWVASAEHDICGINVLFVLPPLDIAGAESLQPILKSVFDTIRRKTSDGFDPTYAPPGGNVGDKFSLPQYANIEEMGFVPPAEKRVVGIDTGYEFGHLPGTGEQWFPMLLMRGFITEKDSYNPTAGGPSKFLGADITGNVVGDDGTKVQATSSTVVQASTTQPPTITGLLGTSGPVAGGTPVTIEGTGFQPGPPLVFFGPPSDPQYPTSVTYQSADLLVVVTPAMQGAGTVDITVINRDGQQVTLPQAFTFT